MSMDSNTSQLLHKCKLIRQIEGGQKLLLVTTAQCNATKFLFHVSLFNHFSNIKTDMHISKEWKKLLV